MANRSIMFIGPRINLSFLGLQARRMKYSRVKKLTVMTSMTLMICNKNGYSTSPLSLYWSSSIVDMINVNVEIKTIVNEKNAQNLIKIFFIKTIYLNHILPSCFACPWVFHCIPQPGSPFTKKIIPKVFLIGKLHFFFLCSDITIFFILTNLEENLIKIIESNFAPPQF